MRIYLSCFFMIAALVFAMTCAPGLEPTAPGVACVLSCLAVLSLLGKRQVAWGCASVVLAAVGYAAWRMGASPIKDYARSDATLLITGASAFWWVLQVGRDRAGRIFCASIWLVAVANVVVGIWQWQIDPLFMPLFANRKVPALPCGFYGHYNHFANYLLASGMLAAGAAMMPGRSRWTRWLLGVIAILCVFGVGISQSRGGYLAAIVGILVLLLGWVIDLHRRKVRWVLIPTFLLIISVPLLAAGAWEMAPQILAKRLQVNDQHGDSLLADGGRIAMAGMAVSTMLDHLLLGGGSRSFGYECYRYWNSNELKVDYGNPEFAHNEWLQTATDYGAIGLLMLGLIWLVTGVRGMVLLSVKSGGDEPDTGVTLGALAALAAVTTQSMFSFVFHVAVDVLVCGALLGFVACQPWPLARREVKPPRRFSISAVSFQLSAFLLAASGVWLCWRDVPAWYVDARRGMSVMGRGPEEKLRTATMALAWRKDFQIEKRAAKAADAAAANDAGNRELFARIALGHWRNVVARHPLDYAARLSLANSLDENGHLEEADQHFVQLLPLVDVREMYYHARYSYALHCVRRGEALWRARNPEDALAWLMEAEKQFETSSKIIWNYNPKDPKWEPRKRARQLVEFLQGARVEPRVEAVPHVPETTVKQ